MKRGDGSGGGGQVKPEPDVYPESLRGARMSAFVEAMNDCTGK